MHDILCMKIRDRENDLCGVELCCGVTETRGATNTREELSTTRVLHEEEETVTVLEGVVAEEERK